MAHRAQNHFRWRAFSLATLKHRWKPLLLGILKYLGTGILSVVIFVGTPLKDWVLHKFWGEKVAMEIQSETGNTVKLHDIVRVRVDVQSKSIASIPDAKISVRDENGILDPTAEPSDQLAGLSSIAIVPSSEKAPFSFRATKVGEAKLIATFETNHGTQSSLGKLISVIARDRCGRPSSTDYSGTWLITIGPYNGSMCLQQEGIKLTGTFKLGEGGPSGLVSGSRDANLTLTFNDEAEPKKWVVFVPSQGISVQNDTIGVTSEATVFEGRGEWRGVGKQGFVANADTRP
jgi:hypothetical protein